MESHLVMFIEIWDIVILLYEWENWSSERLNIYPNHLSSRLELEQELNQDLLV